MLCSGNPEIDSIWIYTLANNTLASLGTMYHARRGHIVLPVEGLSCP